MNIGQEASESLLAGPCRLRTRVCAFHSAANGHVKLYVLDGCLFGIYLDVSNCRFGTTDLDNGTNPLMEWK